MKAVVVKKFGVPDGLHVTELDTPVPNEDEVRVRIRATSVTFGDALLRRMTFPAGPFFRLALRVGKKNALGHEFAGEIETVGENVTRFKIGDRVFGTTGVKGGACAEYICLPEDAAVTTMSTSMSFEEAAVVPVGGNTALYILRQGDIQDGQKVLVYGASGSVGTYAVQLAKYWGAEVTGVCSGPNLDMVKSLGADNVIDYQKEDFTESEETYDVIFDTVRKISSSKAKGLLKENGIFLSSTFSTKESIENLEFLKEIIELGKLRPIIDRRYMLEDIIEAHRYVDTGRKKGNVAITIA
ncbi:MAG: NAD(P)-dependent alcohol dehydrogenase [Candidatus Thorarchaeota archaeon]